MFTFLGMRCPVCPEWGVHFGAEYPKSIGSDSVNVGELRALDVLSTFPDFHHSEEVNEDEKLNCTVTIEENLYSSIEKLSFETGVWVETLVNLWLQQKMEE